MSSPSLWVEFHWDRASLPLQYLILTTAIRRPHWWKSGCREKTIINIKFYSRCLFLNKLVFATQVVAVSGAEIWGWACLWVNMCTIEASAVGLSISTHQLFFHICQLLLCLLTASLAAATGMGKGTCQNQTWGVSSFANNLATDGESSKMWPVCIEALTLKLILHTQHWQPRGHGKLSFHSGGGKYKSS